MSLEDKGFSCLCASGATGRGELTWGLGVLGAGAIASFGLGWLVENRSLAEGAEKKLGRLRRRVEIDPKTGLPTEKVFLTQKNQRAKKLSIPLAPGPKGAEVVSEELPEGINIDTTKGEVTIVDEKTGKPRRVPRKKRLDEIYAQLSPNERKQVEEAVYMETVSPDLPSYVIDTLGLPKDNVLDMLKRAEMTEDRQVGVEVEEVPFTDEELDSPIVPTSEKGERLLLYKLGAAPRPENFDQLVTEYAIETGQDPKDVEIEFAISRGEAGYTTLRELGIKSRKVYKPVVEVVPKRAPIGASAATDEGMYKISRARVFNPDTRGDTRTEFLMREAARIKAELDALEAAKERKKLLDQYWPDRDLPPEPGRPEWINRMWVKRKGRMEDEQERIKNRILGRNAGRFYSWEQDFKAASGLQDITFMYGKDDTGKFIGGYVLEDEYTNKVPIAFEDYSPETRVKINEVLRKWRKNKIDKASATKELEDLANEAVRDVNFVKRSSELEEYMKRKRGPLSRLRFKTTTKVGPEKMKIKGARTGW